MFPLKEMEEGVTYNHQNGEKALVPATSLRT